jgi:hypothetical protein
MRYRTGYLCLLTSILLAGGFASRAEATPCPTVMIVLDVSGSMGDTPDGSGNGPSKMDIAKSALNTLIMKYGDRIPFGFTTFTSTGIDCNQGVQILVEPKHGTSSQILQQVAAATPTGGTNTGEAVNQVAADPAMHDPSRPSSYILLITDGEPNCDSTDPSFTEQQVLMAAQASTPIKSYVIGFGALPSADQMVMDAMAQNGGVPCQGAACNGHKFYAADSAMALDAAIDAISQQISGEFGTVCDDSCYSNACPNAGQICVAGMCKSDPCANVASTCAPGDYCYTDGNSPGTCVHACSQPCAAGQVCTNQGTCQADPCATASCPTGQVCRGGQCVADSCGAAGCMLIGQTCYEGQCIDDPCRYITCPTGTTCVSGTGACALGTGSGSGTTGRGRAASGCELEPGARSSLAALLLFAAALLLISRRRRRRA